MTAWKLFKKLMKDERGFIASSAALAPIIGAGLGAVTGAAKSGAAQSRKDKDLQLAAETARYSPWTNMNASGALQQAQGQQGANYFGDIMQGGFAGGMQGNEISKSNAWNDLLMKKFGAPESQRAALDLGVRA